MIVAWLFLGGGDLWGDTISLRTGERLVGKVIAEEPYRLAREVWRARFPEDAPGTPLHRI